MMDDLLLIEITAILVVLLATLVSMRLISEHEQKQLQKCSSCKGVLKIIKKVEKKRTKKTIQKQAKKLIKKVRAKNEK